MAKDRSYEATGRKKHDFGRGSRWCKRCGDYTAVIQKYDLMLCRRCFREVATSLGFRKNKWYIMPATNVLANLFVTIYNNETRRKQECVILPTSKLGIEVLKTLQKSGYIGEFEHVDDKRGAERTQFRLLFQFPTPQSFSCLIFCLSRPCYTNVITAW